MLYLNLNREGNQEMDQVIKASVKRDPKDRYEIQELETLFIKNQGLARSRRVLPSPEQKKDK